MSKRVPQWKRVLQYLEMFGSITAWEAMKELNIMRLSARIFDLRAKHGIDIQTDVVYSVNIFGDPIRYGVYRKAA
jgi:hypothetical protein